MPIPIQVLHPGDVYLADRGERLETLLGSCVSVLLTDSKRTVGVMNHIVSVAQPSAANRNDTRFAPVAMRKMDTLLKAKGFPIQYCHAWVFGGGNMFPQMGLDTSIGNNNVQWVRDYLQDAGIRVLGESVLGASYRKIGWTVGDEWPDIEVVPVDADPMN